MRLCNRPIPDNTTGMLIPYDEDFVRVKLFPPIVTPEGKPITYLQPRNSAVRAYILPSIRPVLTDPAQSSICITEGENAGAGAGRGRHLAGWEIQLSVEGLVGGRADPGSGSDDLGGAYRLSGPRQRRLGKGASAPGGLSVGAPPRAAQSRGVNRTTAPQAGQEKTSADDFLVAKGLEVFRKLVEKAVPLGHPAFKPYPEQEKAKARAEGQAEPPLPAELVNRRISPALHFDRDGFAAVDIVTVSPDRKEQVEIVTSGRQRDRAEAVRQILQTVPLAYRDLANRWRPERLTRFLAGDGAIFQFAAVARILDRWDALMQVHRDAEAVIAAIWALAIYFYSGFRAFPRLDLRSEKQSGNRLYRPARLSAHSGCAIPPCRTGAAAFLPG